VAELLSQRLDEPLGLLDSLRLRLHLSMCDNCSQVAKQLASMQALSAELFAAGGSTESEPSGRDPRG
jgi:predicted anti-sigma-YlaC factor YlaD